MSLFSKFTVVFPGIVNLWFRWFFFKSLFSINAFILHPINPTSWIPFYRYSWTLNTNAVSMPGGPLCVTCMQWITYAMCTWRPVHKTEWSRSLFWYGDLSKRCGQVKKRPGQNIPPFMYENEGRNEYICIGLTTYWSRSQKWEKKKKLTTHGKWDCGNKWSQFVPFCGFIFERCKTSV